MIEHVLFVLMTSLVCIGFFFLAAAHAYRVYVDACIRKKAFPIEDMTQQHVEEDNGADKHLAKRLNELQTSRFSPPISVGSAAYNASVRSKIPAFQMPRQASRDEEIASIIQFRKQKINR